MKRISIILMILLLSFSALPVQAASQDEMRIYSILTDRFMNGDENNNKDIHNDKDNNLPYGGDFKGIINKVDYIKKMGFNAIHVSPVFDHDKNDYLGYKINNYNQISKTFGGEKDFKQLVYLAHKNNMKVIVDMPVVATDDFTVTEDTKMNAIEKSYYKDTPMIDLTNEANIKRYKQLMTEFVNKTKVDGLSMYVLQDNVDLSKVFPENITKIAITNSDVKVTGYDYIQTGKTSEQIAQAFKNVDEQIPEQHNKKELLSADNFFTPRFTSYAVHENMFPGTRIKQMMGYLFVQKQPVSMTYGTEIAMNGEKLPDTHQLLDFRTDKEVVEYLEQTSEVYHKYKEMFDGTSKVIYNEKGEQLIYFDTDKVDFIYNINDTSKSTNVKLTDKDIPGDKMLSGLLIGDRIHVKDGTFNLITNREETELYALVPPRGLNLGYVIASLLTIILFTVFIIGAARNRKKHVNNLRK